jgi:cell division protein FtsL
VSILGVLLLMAMFHALIVQGQRELDRMNGDIETATSVNDRLQLELAQMEAPERIVAAARSYGMVDAPEVVYLSPAVETQEAAGQ